MRIRFSVGMMWLAVAGPRASGHPAYAQAPATASALSQPRAFVAPGAWPRGEGTSLGDQIAALLTAPAAVRAHWGIAVAALDGTPIYGLDEARLFRPASSTKLFTTAAAMAILGPESTATTAVYGDLDPATGAVRGPLVLKGGGDPSFGTADLPYVPSSAESPVDSTRAGLRDLHELADQIATAGVRRINGGVVGDAKLFATEPPPEGWAEEDLLWGYGAPASALSIGDDAVTVIVRPAEGRSRPGPGPDAGAMVTVEQIVPYVQVRSSVSTAGAGTAAKTAAGAGAGAGRTEAIGWERSRLEPAGLVVYGTIAAGHPPQRERISIDDPAAYAAQALQAQLLARGMHIDGEATALHGARQVPAPFLHTLTSPAPCAAMAEGEPVPCAPVCGITPHRGSLLAQHISPPLRDEVKFTLKTSANLHAEVLLHRLGLKAACAGDSTLDGARMVRAWLLQAGLEDGDFLFYDGSGLSMKDLITPRAEVQLLAYAATQSWFSPWKAALPIGGVDGTLSSRFTEAPLKGHVFAKTGTLGESRALAGYVQCASGREVIFAILEDDHEPGSAADRGVLDRIVAAIAAND